MMGSILSNTPDGPSDDNRDRIEAELARDKVRPPRDYTDTRHLCPHCDGRFSYDCHGAACYNCWEVRKRFEEFLKHPKNVKFVQDELRKVGAI